MDIDLQETVEQLGGAGLYGALVYTGTRRIIKGKDYISLQVNGKPGFGWFITITLDPSDTYIVELAAHRGDKVESLAKETDVYCDELQRTVEQMYDEAIKKHNRGFIPLR